MPQASHVEHVMTPAEIALTTAHAFFKDVDEELQGKTTAAPAELLNTLALGSRKLIEAEKLDPRAALKHNDGMSDVTIQDIKAMGVGLEGKIQLLSGDFKKSIATFERAIALKPDFALSWASKGAAHAQLMQKSEAIAALGKAIELDPENIDYHKALAEAQSISGAEQAAATAGKIWRWRHAICLVIVILASQNQNSETMKMIGFATIAFWIASVAIPQWFRERVG